MVNKSAANIGQTPVYPGVRKILAPNPSMMTQNGTNTYILGTGRVAVIDPGPAIERHTAAILSALEPDETISHIFVTHSHLDHSGMAPHLATITGAPVYAFGGATAGRSARMKDLASILSLGGGEGVDQQFKPDIVLADREKINATTWAVEAIHTPGHMGNHLCYAFGNMLFSGDHIMGWSSSMISPPDGDMTDYMMSLQKLLTQSFKIIFPGHGSPITEPKLRVGQLIAHRLAREAALLDGLGGGARTVAALTNLVYPDIDLALLAAAQRNVFAHLIDLHGRNLVRSSPNVHLDANFTLV